MNKRIEKIFNFIICECAVAAVLICVFLAMKNFTKTEEVVQSPPVQVDIAEETVVQPEEIVFEPIVSNVEMVMVGDCLIHEPLYLGAEKENGVYDFSHMFKNIKSDIQDADIAIINQETIFIEDKKQYSSYPKFGSPTAVGDAEVEAGFDVVAHSTNHTIDKKEQGILDTINFWETKHPDIKVLGIHDSPNDSDIEYLEHGGIKFSFVNYTYGLNGLESWRTGKEYLVDMLMDNNIEQTLSLAENNSDIVVAILHVGDEYVYKPTDYANKQINRMIDNGADIVLCSHPHVVQPYGVVETEQGNKALVYYSLGNFISAQDQYPRILGGMAKINIQKTEYEEYDEIIINDYSMVPLVTHMEYRYYTTYKLDDYTLELEQKHYLQRKSAFTKEMLYDLYNEIVGNVSMDELIIKTKDTVIQDSLIVD